MLIGLSFLSAQGMYEVGLDKPYKTISEAWEAIREDVLDTYTIQVDAGTYIESELQGIPDVKITIIGSGADKTFIQRASLETFEMLDGQQAGYLFRTHKTNYPCDNMELTCENMTFQYIGATKHNWGGAVVVAEGQNQKYSFKNCNFRKIFVRQGAIIAATAAAATPVSFSMENCFIEDSGEYDFNNIAGMMFFKWGAELTLRNVTFMNNDFELHNQHPTDASSGQDLNRKNGLIIHMEAADAYPSNILIENVNIINSSITAESTSLLPMIRVKAASPASVSAMIVKDLVMLSNVRAETPDCDFAYSSDVTPILESCVFNSVKSEAAGEFIDVEELDGAEILSDAKSSSYFEMEGAAPKIYTDDKGVKSIKRVMSGIKFQELDNDITVFTKNGLITLSGLQGISRVLVYDMLGKIVQDITTQSQSVDFNLQGGVYIVKVGTANLKIAL